ncbi:hypothetical protein BDV24DRAFT_161337 [Aspergillus arachidicola]|uniref:Uncharacterized protein n=1 Tax=Aspergillus arachidicola TaxID=656916 RepID=A0A5N6YFN1_9EURO|nr:hypothetical protein BDV24DRAFT_161337 [Aspergillus arachidicola]
MSQHNITCGRHEIFFQRLAAYLSSLQPKAEHSQFPDQHGKSRKPRPLHLHFIHTGLPRAIFSATPPFGVSITHLASRWATPLPLLLILSDRSPTALYLPTPKHHETCRQGPDTGRYQSHPSIQGARRSSTSANWRASSPYSYELSFTVTTFVFHVLP